MELVDTPDHDDYVAAGGRGQGVVVLRQVDELLGKPLKLSVEQPGGRGKVVVDRGVALR